MWYNGFIFSATSVSGIFATSKIHQSKLAIDSVKNWTQVVEASYVKEWVILLSRAIARIGKERLSIPTAALEVYDIGLSSMARSTPA